MSKKYTGKVELRAVFMFETTADSPKEAIQFIQEDVQEIADEEFDGTECSVKVIYIDEVEDDSSAV